VGLVIDTNFNSPFLTAATPLGQQALKPCAFTE
jgi:hypothetical protein